MNQPKMLSPQQIQGYRDSGYVSPVRVMSAAEAQGYRGKLEAFERQQGEPLNGNQRAKTYLLFTWAYAILTHPKVLDAVEDLIGPDIMAYHWTSWIKEPQSPGFVSWHQDATYFGLQPLDQVTAWVALSCADQLSGCMRMLPGSNRLGQLPAELKPHQDNLLSSGQSVQHAFNENDTLEMPLLPGEMSLHNTCTIHGSPGNRSDDRRIGFCLNFIPAHVKPNAHLLKSGALCSALLVRGRKHHDLFPPEMPPTGDADPASIASHTAGIANYRRMVQALGHMTAARLD